MKHLSSCVIWSVLMLGVVSLALVKLSVAAVNKFGEWAFEKKVQA